MPFNFYSHLRFLKKNYTDGGNEEALSNLSHLYNPLKNKINFFRYFLQKLVDHKINNINFSNEYPVYIKISCASLKFKQ